MPIFPLHSCLNCGSFFVRAGLVCSFCENKIRNSEFFGLRQSIENDLCVYSLVEWVPGESDILSALLISLKGGRQKTAWQFWAEIFWQERVLSFDPEERICFIPAPSDRLTGNHALLFARALAQISGGDLKDPLKKVSSSRQRRFNREKRAQVKVSSAVKIAGPERQKRYILVDDVLTTGATAKACYEALEKPPYFEVWALGKRGLACGPPGDLL